MQVASDRTMCHEPEPVLPLQKPSSFEIYLRATIDKGSNTSLVYMYKQCNYANAFEIWILIE